MSQLGNKVETLPIIIIIIIKYEQTFLMYSNKKLKIICYIPTIGIHIICIC